jgi:hypothetical protein
MAPINKMLEIFQLEQYSPLLASNGFPHQFNNKKSMQMLDEMVEHVSEKDKKRFIFFLKTFDIMSKAVKKQTFISEPSSKSASKTRKYHYAHPSLSSNQSKHHHSHSTQKSSLS